MITLKVDDCVSPKVGYSIKPDQVFVVARVNERGFSIQLEGSKLWWDASCFTARNLETNDD